MAEFEVLENCRVTGGGGNRARFQFLVYAFCSLAISSNSNTLAANLEATAGDGPQETAVFLLERGNELARAGDYLDAAAKFRAAIDRARANSAQDVLVTAGLNLARAQLDAGTAEQVSEALAEASSLLAGATAAQGNATPGSR